MIAGYHDCIVELTDGLHSSVRKTKRQGHKRIKRPYLLRHIKLTPSCVLCQPLLASLPDVSLTILCSCKPNHEHQADQALCIVWCSCVQATVKPKACTAMLSFILRTFVCRVNTLLGITGIHHMQVDHKLIRALPEGRSPELQLRTTRGDGPLQLFASPRRARKRIKLPACTRWVSVHVCSSQP